MMTRSIFVIYASERMRLSELSSDDQQDATFDALLFLLVSIFLHG